MNTEIQDFGVKIGGAKKDLWRTRGLIHEDTKKMTSAEKSKFIKRDNIWPKIDEQKLLSIGIPRLVVYWQKEMRKTIYPDLKNVGYDEKNIERYISVVIELKEKVMEARSIVDINEFSDMAYKKILSPLYGSSYYYKERYKDILKTGKAFTKLINPRGISNLENKMNKEGFGISKEQLLREQYFIGHIDGSSFFIETEHTGKSICELIDNGKRFYYPISSDLQLTEGEEIYALMNQNTHKILFVGDQKKCEQEKEHFIKKELLIKESKNRQQRKQKWIPPQLAYLNRVGKDYRQGRNVTGDDFIRAFGIRGGEFGNWTNHMDRQENLNMAFDALMDLADALQISRTDISLPGLETGALALAFGARGRGNALAHYEPLREVINLTKKKGAGNLAHEWGHALDDFIGKMTESSNDGRLASEKIDKSMPESFLSLIKAMQMDKNHHQTNYYKDSSNFGRLISKNGHGYWNSRCEMFARAFACYVKDKLDKNDYLCGHAESCTAPIEDGLLYAYPIGEERKLFNQLFDQLFIELKNRGYLHDPIKNYEFMKGHSINHAYGDNIQGKQMSLEFIG